MATAVFQDRVSRLLRGNYALRKNCVGAWHHLWGEQARQHGGGILTGTVTTDAVGSRVFDPREGRIVTAPQNRLAFGAPQNPAFTNLLTMSGGTNDFNTMSNKNEVTCATSPVAAPDGSLTATRVTESVNTTTHYPEEAVEVADATTYYGAAFYHLGGAGGRNAQLQFGNNGLWSGGSPTVRLEADGTLFSSGGTLQYGAWRVVNGWWYLWMTGLSVGAGTSFHRNYLLDGVTASYEGDGASYLDMWGATFGVASRPGAHVHNADATPVARTADALRYTNSPLWSGLASEGTLLVCFRSPYAGTVPSADTYIAGLNGSDSTDDFAGFRIDSTNDDLRAVIRSGGSDYASIDIGSMAANTDYAAAVAWKANDVRAALNGTLGTPDTSATMPTGLTALEIGGGESGDTRSGMSYYTVLAFDRALTNAELRNLTRNPAALKWAG